MKKVYIWLFALRISHFIMIISFFFFGGGGRYFSEGFVHAFFGSLFVLVMLGISVFLVVLATLLAKREWDTLLLCLKL